MSLRKQGKDTYRIDIYLGREVDPETGKFTKIRGIHTFTGKQKAAEAEERRLLRERDLGLYVAPSNETVNEYLARWLRDYAKVELAGTTYEGYARCVNRYVEPRLGDMPLCKVRPQNVQAMYTALRDRPARGGGKLSAHTVLHLHRVLREAFKHAVQDQILAVNPCDAVRPPRREEKEMKSITEAETARLLQGLQGTPYHIPVLLAVSCGLRRGEFLALRWKDVDLHAHTLSVRQALEQTKAGVTTKAPKTKKSARTLSIPVFVVAMLKTHKAEQAARKLEQGNTWKDNDLVFPAPDGAPWSPSYFSRMFTYHARRLKVDCRLHDLRHSHATQMLRQGIHPKIVSERLGHSKVGFTLDTYTHALVGMDEQAARKVGAALQTAIAKNAKSTRLS
jgi:integrase